MKTKFSKYLKKINNKITLSIGEVKILKKIGEGGNGIVYEGTIYGKSYALKFLLPNVKGNSFKKKKERFLAEYINVLQLDNKKGIIKYINYDNFSFEIDGENFTVPVIIMKKYESSLKKLEINDIDDINIISKFKDIFNFLLDTVEEIHKEGIIHRDIKPENILVRNSEYVLTDFGIASYNPELFKLRAKTKENERIGNRLFSAPEQEIGGIEAHETMDIYAIGQILHWLVYGNTHRGTNRKLISDKIKELNIYDNIIDNCLSNDPKERYQSIEEIRTFLNNIKRKDKDIWDYMYDFNKILLKNFPKNEFGIIHSDNIKKIDRLFSALKENENKFGNMLWWHNGSSNLHFTLTKKGDGIWKLNQKEIKIKEIWIHYDTTVFNDFIMVHFDKGEPFIVEGKEQYYNVIVDDKYEISYSEYQNKTAEINDEIIDLNEHKVEYIEREKEEGYLIIATKFNNAILPANDKIVRSFIEKLKLNENNLTIQDFIDFENQIRPNMLEQVRKEL